MSTPMGENSTIHDHEFFSMNSTKLQSMTLQSNENNINRDWFSFLKSN